MHPADATAQVHLGPSGKAVPSVDETPALYLPIYALKEAHIGRKVRLDGQVLAFDPASGQLLLTSGRNPHTPTGRQQTVLVDVRVALSGQSPAATDVGAARDGVKLNDIRAASWEGRYEAPRLSLQRGAWVTVVGWLEGDIPTRAKKMLDGTPYAAPFPAILEAINIAGRTAPPLQLN